MATSPMTTFIQRLRGDALLGKYSTLNDGQLLNLFISRQEKEALEALLRRHAQMVWNICCRVLHNHYDAEDAFQATFLVFVQKVASISSRATVANWLYGVAHKTALAARRSRSRQELRERKSIMPETAIMMGQNSCSNLQAVLDQELSRLPEKYRTVIVLCDLEGKTKKEAALELNISEGTVASRVARARTLLAKRLSQFSGVVSAVTLATWLAQNSTRAAVPSSLMITTITAVNLRAAGQNLAGVALPGVLALAKGVIRDMFVCKCITLILAAFASLLCACAIVGAARTIDSRGRQPEPQANTGQSAAVIPQPPGQDKKPPNPPARKNDLPKPLPSDIVKAWQNAGAEIGWMKVEDGGFATLGLFTGPEPTFGALPAFVFTKPTDGVLANLPDPEMPFGLRDVGITDEEMKDLTRLKSLHSLYLGTTPITDAGIKQLAGLPNLRALCLENTQLTDAGVKELAGLKNLQYLDLGTTSLTDAGLQKLAPLKNLQALGLRQTKVTDNGMKQLAGFPSLKSLELSRTQITDNGVKELARVKSLRWLDLSHTEFTDAGLKELGTLKSLLKLDLSNTQVTGVGFSELARLNELQNLVLRRTQITVAGLKEVSRLTNLRDLVLDNTNVTNAGIKELSASQNLQFLQLGHTNVTDAGLKDLSALKSLQGLVLTGTKVTDAGLKTLTELKGLQSLSLDHTQITDAGLKELASLKGLRFVLLENTKVTAAGIAAFRKALPACEVFNTPLVEVSPQPSSPPF